MTNNFNMNLLIFFFYLNTICTFEPLSLRYTVTLVFLCYLLDIIALEYYGSNIVHIIVTILKKDRLQHVKKHNKTNNVIRDLNED